MKNAILALCLLFVPALSFASIEALTIETQDVEAQVAAYNFGHRPVNSRTMADFKLTANGNAPVEIMSVQIKGMMYSATHNCPSMLYPGQSCIARVAFIPTTDGTFTGLFQFNLRSNTVKVRLSGSAFY